MTRPIATSSLGAPGLDLEAFLDLAVRHGCTSVELRAGDQQVVSCADSPLRRQQVRDALAHRGLALLSVNAYARLCAPGDDAAFVEDAVAHLDLATDLGATGVRVFPGGTGDDGDLVRARSRLAALAEHPRAATAFARNVRLLLETHDSHPTGAAAASLLAAAPDPGTIAVIWDVAHTARGGERPADTIASLGAALAHVQVKDLSGLDASAPPALVGEGVLDLDEVLRVLDSTAHAGPLCLEWERAWFPDLPDLDTALTGFRAWVAARDTA